MGRRVVRVEQHHLTWFDVRGEVTHRVEAAPDEFTRLLALGPSGDHVVTLHWDCDVSTFTGCRVVRREHYSDGRSVAPCRGARVRQP